MISECIIFSQNHIRCRCSTRACVKALVTLSTFQKDEAAGHEEKKKVWVKPRELGKKESIGSWSTMELYYMLVFISLSRRDAVCDLV